ncbi:helix-turn-helix domain-containing protein [Hyphomonas sp. GM-8P]|jgi:transcriptional regulator with XRE-family HTH domain|uniref:helix-turn-helix domain-containing protein n=1 Tax=Hyphomonas sp. GM-8P TaxID=1280945 RepID=UPI000DD4D82D|nr:helix-turn-helix transcriptional regulator [Hyphomonas sp. GM-8P]
MTNAQREQLAAAIRAARRSKGLTQEALAERINRTSASLSNLERAQSLPSLETLVLIAEALDVPIGSLLDFPATRGKTRSRIREENEIMDMVRSLSAEQLRIARMQIEALGSMKK